jgi:hypothetical protein
MMQDPIVDEVHRAFDRVLERCGGTEGLFKYLRAMDRLRKTNAQRAGRGQRSHVNRARTLPQPIHSETQTIMTDPIVDEVQRVREELLKRYGGIDGYFRHIQAMDRARLRREKARRQKRAKESGHTNSTAAASRPRRKKVRRVTSRRTSRATV